MSGQLQPNAVQIGCGHFAVQNTQQRDQGLGELARGPVDVGTIGPNPAPIDVGSGLASKVGLDGLPRQEGSKPFAPHLKGSPSSNPGSGCVSGWLEGSLQAQ